MTTALLLLAALGQTTDQLPRGCVQMVFVLDAGQVRQLERHEIHHTRPGAGTWGPWIENFCRPRYARAWTHDGHQWPRRISDDEVRRLLGQRRYHWFATHLKVTTSEWWNFTGLDGYEGPGIHRTDDPADHYLGRNR